jgi:DNA-binding transcriptional ArsR family regulator
VGGDRIKRHIEDAWGKRKLKTVKIRIGVGVPKAEGRLHRLLISAITREPVTSGTNRVICSELDVSCGIADVVVATTNSRTINSAWFSSGELTGLNLTTAKLLTRLKYASYLQLSEIGRSVGLSTATVSRHIKKLEEMGIAKRKGDSARLLKSTRIPFAEVTAFEVKVSDWRHGLYQATQYRAFANRVVLALPDVRARAVAVHRGTFRLFGVGLAGLTKSGEITWYVKAARRTPSSASRAVLGFLEILKSREARVLHSLEKP